MIPQTLSPTEYAYRTPVQSTRAYRPLPTCTPQQPDETRQEFAARLLRYLLAESCYNLATADLELADTAACRAAASLPRTLSPADHTVDRKLNAVRTAIAQILTYRRTSAAVSAAPGDAEPPTNHQGGGKTVRPNAPTPSLPPAPGYAQPTPTPTRSTSSF